MRHSGVDLGRARGLRVRVEHGSQGGLIRSNPGLVFPAEALLLQFSNHRAESNFIDVGWRDQSAQAHEQPHGSPADARGHARDSDNSMTSGGRRIFGIGPRG